MKEVPLTKNLYRAILLDGLLTGLMIAFAVSVVLTVLHPEDATHTVGVEGLVCIISFVGWLVVNAWGVIQMDKLRSKLNEEVGDKETDEASTQGS